MQKTFQFTLVLKNADEDTVNLEDKLYQAGCDDALINYRNGAVYLDFDRKACSLEEAVMTAIKEVESSSIGAIVVHVAPEDFVTESDIAKRLHIKRQTVFLWIKRERHNKIPFPKPIMKLSEKSPFWKWREITEWLFNNHIINEENIVNDAIFVENLNAVLDERNVDIKKLRQKSLKKIENYTQ